MDAITVEVRPVAHDGLKQFSTEGVVNHSHHGPPVHHEADGDAAEREGVHEIGRPTVVVVMHEQR